MTVVEHRTKERSDKMKLFARPKCFTEAISWVTNLNCFLGVRAFEYPRGHPRPILSLIYLLFMFTIYFCGSLHMRKIYYATVRLMKLEYILYSSLSYIIIISVMLKMLLGWRYTKRFKICHKKIFEIDETLRQLGLPANYDRLYFVTIGTIIVWITGSFIMCIVVFIHLHMRANIFSSVYIVLIFTYSLTINVINVLEFFLFAKCLKIKFRLVNRLLCESLTNLSIEKMKVGIFDSKDYTEIMNVERKNILSTKIFRWHRRMRSRINICELEKQNSIVSQIESHFPSQFEKQFPNEFRNRFGRYNPTRLKCQERKHLLQTIKQVHLELCKVSKIICTILGAQIAWETGESIMYLTGAFYHLYVRYIMKQKHILTVADQTYVTLALCFVSIVKIVSLSYICKTATDEGNKTIEIIHAIYECDTSTDMQQEIQQFGIQILQCPMKFSAFGLTLDYRLLSSILKTVTTYLVILIQVGNTLESNNAINNVHF